MIALGDIDFIKAQINPALSMRPFSFQTWRKEIKRYTLMKDNIVPERGILRLCRKLPKIISIDAHILPTTEAFNQIELSGLRIIVSIYIFNNQPYLQTTFLFWQICSLVKSLRLMAKTFQNLSI